ncbi:hypothetical protein ACHAL6_00735 [Proteiniclasticum sp. C24MP]
MNRAEYIRRLSDEELAMYLYHNKKSTGLGYKRITEWVKEEVKPEEEDRR